jgi:hypothetical protein
LAVTEESSLGASAAGSPTTVSAILRLFVPGRRGDGLQRVEVSFGSQPPETAGGLTLRRGSIAADQTQVVAKYASVGDAVELLRREVGVAEYLAPAASSLVYPDGLSRVVGFNLDAVPPMLVATWRGEPLTALSRNNELPLPAHQQPGAVKSLLAAVAFLSAANYVHCGLSPSTVRWDGESLQVTDLGHATIRGKMRSAKPTVPPPRRLEDFLARAGETVADRDDSEDGFWRPPAGDGIARFGDDVYALAALLLFACTNERPEPGADLAGWLARQDGDLRGQLAGAFAPDPEDRPSALELAERVGLPSLLEAVRRSERSREHDEEVRARAHFRELNDRKADFQAQLTARTEAASSLENPTARARVSQDFVGHLVGQYLAGAARTQSPPLRQTPPLQRRIPERPAPSPPDQPTRKSRLGTAATLTVLLVAVAILLIVVVIR